jgi:hypothetical protein
MQEVSMKYKVIGPCVLLLIAICLFTSFVSGNLPKPFTDLLDRANMTFVAPDSLVPVNIIETRALAYDYALKYPSKNFEIRYAIRPSDNLWKDYDQSSRNPLIPDKESNPDSSYTSALQTIILNCSGELPKVTEFEKAAVKTEFGADWGGTVFIHPRKSFGQSYKFCMLVALHKNRAGEAYIFYLSDSQDGFNEAVMPVFHALKFK